MYTNGRMGVGVQCKVDNDEMKKCVLLGFLLFRSLGRWMPSQQGSRHHSQTSLSGMPQAERYVEMSVLAQRIKIDIAYLYRVSKPSFHLYVDTSH